MTAPNPNPAPRSNPTEKGIDLRGIDTRPTEAIAMLRQWLPSDAGAAVAQRRILQFLSTAPHPFDREADPHHITGSAVVSSSAGFLLHRHKRSGDWIGPGGHVDASELPWETAARETLEETGIEARQPSNGPLLVHVDIHPTVIGHLHFDLRFLLLAEPEMPNPPPEESQDVEWLTYDQAMVRTDDSYHAALLAARSQQSVPLR